MNQKEIIENIFIYVNEITQSLLYLQEEVVKLNFDEEETEMVAPVKVEKKEEVKVERVREAVKVYPKKQVKRLTPSFLKKFRTFTLGLINAKREGNSVTISYNVNGQSTTFNTEEIYDIFINLPDKFDKEIVSNCIKELGLDAKNEILLMRFFVYQFSDYCEKTSKGTKDKLIIRKL